MLMLQSLSALAQAPYEPPTAPPPTTSPPSAPPPSTAPYEPPSAPGSPAAPPEPPPEPLEARRLFSIEATLGLYDGFGGGIRFGNERVGAHLIAGWQPLLVAATNELDFEFYFFSSAQLNADLYLMFNPTRRFVAGVTAGYKFNTVLGHGGGLGFYGEINPRRKLSFFIMAGFWLFPRGEQLLRQSETFPANTEFSFPGPGFNLGGNFGISFSP